MLANPVLLDVWTYWQDKRAGRRMPLVADIDLAELGVLARSVLIVENDKEGRFRYGAVGSSIQKIYGYPMEGMYLDAALPPERLGPAVRRYTLACERGIPLLARSAHSVTASLSFCVDRIILPLAGPDGTCSGALCGQLMRSRVEARLPESEAPPEDDQLTFLDDVGQVIG